MPRTIFSNPGFTFGQGWRRSSARPLPGDTCRSRTDNGFSRSSSRVTKEQTALGGVETSQLPAFLLRPRYLSDRHLDASRRKPKWSI